MRHWTTGHVEGQADFRNSLLTKQQAARAVKCRKALNPPQVIDLSDDKSDDEALKHQTNLEGIIDLINADSPAVHAQQRNRPACAAGPSGHSLQPHPASLPSSQCFSRKAGSHHDNLTHHKYSSSSALPGSNTSMPSSHSSRKRTASSPDTIGLGPASSLGQPTSSVPSSTMSEASSTSMPPPSSSPWLKPTHALLNSSQAGSLAQPVSRPPSTRQHESRTELTPSDPGGGPIDLVHVAESTREHEGRRGFAPSDPRGGHVDLVEVPESTRQPEGRKGLAPSELRGSHIDLVKVTGNYSGALQAASRRVQHATTDPALAKALAEKAELERQLQEALANKQACHPNQPLRAPMPSHWTDMPPSASVEYVELPLPPGCSPACGPLADPPALPPLDEGVLKAMMYQLPRADAEAALRHCKGDGDVALLYASCCHSRGGAAAVARRRLAAAAPTSSQHFAQAAAQQACKEADLPEAQLVMARLTANNSTIQLSSVVRIERVQNPHLWTKYCLRRHEVELAAGAGNVNEQLLFHGCSKDTLAIIGAEGFDIRVSGMSCSLGAGTYFAGNSSYSVGYVDKGPGMTAVPSMAMQWGAFPTGMPGYAPGAQFPTWVSGFSRAPNPNILPHPSMHGVTKSSGKTSAHAKAKQPQKDPSKPQFTPDTKAMFLCRVALGRLAVGQPGLRLPPKGSDSVSNNGRHSIQTLGQSIFAVFDNAQAYPEFVIHFRQR